jgi:hypothetical protein
MRACLSTNAAAQMGGSLHRRASVTSALSPHAPTPRRTQKHTHTHIHSSLHTAPLEHIAAPEPFAQLSASAGVRAGPWVALNLQSHLTFCAEAAAPCRSDRLPDRASLRGQSCSHQLLHRRLPRPWALNTTAALVMLERAALLRCLPPSPPMANTSAPVCDAHVCRAPRRQTIVPPCARAR